jgi:hypothetical protein
MQRLAETIGLVVGLEEVEGSEKFRVGGIAAPPPQLWQPYIHQSVRVPNFDTTSSLTISFLSFNYPYSNLPFIFPYAWYYWRVKKREKRRLSGIQYVGRAPIQIYTYGHFNLTCVIIYKGQKQAALSQECHSRFKLFI